MQNKIDSFRNEAEKLFGDDYVGFVGDQWQTTGQITVATGFEDRGESEPAPLVGEFETLAKKIFGHRVAVLPYPVKGRLIYVVAGLLRAAR